MSLDDGAEEDDGLLLEISITVHRNALFTAVTRVEGTTVLESSAASLEDLLEVVGRNLRKAVT